MAADVEVDFEELTLFPLSFFGIKEVEFFYIGDADDDDDAVDGCGYRDISSEKDVVDGCDCFYPKEPEMETVAFPPRRARSSLSSCCDFGHFPT